MEAPKNLASTFLQQREAALKDSLETPLSLRICPVKLAYPLYRFTGFEHHKRPYKVKTKSSTRFGSQQTRGGRFSAEGFAIRDVITHAHAHRPMHMRCQYVQCL